MADKFTLWFFHDRCHRIRSGVAATLRRAPGLVQGSPGRRPRAVRGYRARWQHCRPWLARKPIIDIDIVVKPDQVDAASAVLQSLGFRRLGELGIPQRWAFKEPATLAGTNTYVIVSGSLALRESPVPTRNASRR